MIKEYVEVKALIFSMTCGGKMIGKHDEKTKFYTGLLSWGFFSILRVDLVQRNFCRFHQKLP